ncbi:MAG: hypothetical protein JST16_10450 [Bdellovibrionales bacterium]|nr:hypothetical protein [Bdellovibrionales bacterium]
MKNLTWIGLGLIIAAPVFAAEVAARPLSDSEAMTIERVLRNDLYVKTFNCPRTHKFGYESYSNGWSIVDESIRATSGLTYSKDELHLSFSVGLDRYEIAGIPGPHSDDDSILMTIKKNDQVIATYDEMFLGGESVLEGIFYALDVEPTQVTDVSLAQRCRK